MFSRKNKPFKQRLYLRVQEGRLSELFGGFPNHRKIMDPFKGPSSLILKGLVFLYVKKWKNGRLVRFNRDYTTQL